MRFYIEGTVDSGCEGIERGSQRKERNVTYITGCRARRIGEER